MIEIVGNFKYGVTVRPRQDLQTARIATNGVVMILQHLQQTTNFTIFSQSGNGISHQPECSKRIIRHTAIADDTSVVGDVIDLTSRLYNEQSTDTNVFHCPDKGQSRLIRVTTVIIFSYTIPALSLSLTHSPPPPN